MSASPIAEVLAQSAPPPMSGAPPGAPPQVHPFKDALAEVWARTANAEGQVKGSRSGDPERRAEQHEHDRRRAPDGSEAAPLTSTTSSQATRPGTGRAAAAASAPVSRPGEQSGAGDASQTASATESTPGATTAPAEIPEGPLEAAEHAPAAAGPTTTSTSTTPPAPAPAPAPSTPPPVSPPPSSAGDGTPTAAPATPAQGEAAARASAQGPLAPAAGPAPSVPAEEGAATRQPSAIQAEEVSRAATASVQSAAPVAGGDEPHPKGSGSSTGSTAAGSLGASSATVAASGSDAPQAPLPSVAAAVAAGQVPGAVNAPLTAAGVQMQDMIESIHATIELATQQGISQARISLQPAELGDIRIHLSQTGDGLLARVTAETPAAAQALAAARGELHQALSSSGATLLRLDIGSFGQAEGREERNAGSSAGASRSSGTTDGEETIEAAGTAREPGAASTQILGELVDVLA